MNGKYKITKLNQEGKIYKVHVYKVHTYMTTKIIYLTIHSLLEIMFKSDHLHLYSFLRL
jgi:hypothetical protein